MPEDLYVLHKGETAGLARNNQSPNRKNGQENTETVIGVLAPGTGLGQAFIYTSSGQRYIMASEGGHVDFAPTNEVEVELLKYLKSKHEHVSYDRILSGPGLHSYI